MSTPKKSLPQGYRNADRAAIPSWEEATGKKEMYPSSASKSAEHAEGPAGIRLQKVMAAAGVASRRVAEDMIAAGRVEVNGKLVTEPGMRVDPEVDEVRVDGVPVQVDTSKRYIMLNKPTGVVSSMRDENGRPDLTQFTQEYDERLFNVGRLDAETSGLLLLTNDGDVAHVLAHPSFGVMKTYIAKVRGKVSAQVAAKLTKGFDLDDGFIQADKARILSSANDGSSSLVEITLHSGRNRIVRRMMAEVGHPVMELVRRQFGPLTLGTLAVGQMRELTKIEQGQLLALARPQNSVPEGMGADVNETEAIDE